MKIDNTILSLINNGLLSKLTIAKEEMFEDSPLNMVIPIKISDFKMVKCYKCDNLRNNFCWNCQRPHCKNHSYAYFFNFIINTFCDECYSEILKLNKNAANP